jgi:hypothetical protein
MATELVTCPKCHRGVDDSWHYCAYCAYRLPGKEWLPHYELPATGHSISHTISGLMPQLPSEGPPLPKNLGVKWPWV